MLAASCGNRVDETTREKVDSLNELSCKMLYSSGHKAEEYAVEALRLSDNYEDGRMEALCNMGNARTMLNDYDSAQVLFNEVLQSTDNTLYRFHANARMMKICQIMAINKKFYEYRNDAEKCINRIGSDEDVMNRHQRVVWKVTNCLYYLTLASHYHNLRYDEDMLYAQSMYIDWYRALDEDTVMLNQLFTQHDAAYWHNYGNLYYESIELSKKADTLLMDGMPTEALAVMEEALECVNKFYGLTDENQKLKLYDETSMDSISKEMIWIKDPNIVTIPEWMATVREELSIVYGALGMKEASDYNHNIYFDILDATRQDMSLQERQERLEVVNRQLDLYLFALGLMVIVGLVAIILFTSRKERISMLMSDRMTKLQAVCTKMTAAIPVHASDEEEVMSAVHEAVDGDIQALFPTLGNCDWTKCKPVKMNKFDREMLSVLQVLYQWILNNGQELVRLTEESERVEGERYLYSKRLKNNKRQYIDKATSVSIVNGITPFLDRALREVDRLKTADENTSREEMNERLQYIKELVEKIEAFNDVLGHWVKIRQGTVTLSIENFELAPIFETLSKGRTMFEAKHINLDIAHTSAVVKADAALTLFMMNTLMDNARKYTPEGGTVSVKADETEEYVEISVTDTGNGLSEDDVNTLNNNKVYDSTKIGVSNDVNGEIRKNKGFGFGLMNCRGIIEKYRKTNSLFNVCAFGVESKVGEGSRFFFRLPKGKIRALIAVLAFLTSLTSFAAAHKGHENAMRVENVELRTAASYYDSIYNCNLNHDYVSAIRYADSAINYLNRYYLLQERDGTLLMTLEGGKMSELVLYKTGFKTDFSLILDIRNEVAIAALALNRRSLYWYNNEIFTRLYKLLSDDGKLEQYCNSIQESANNKQMILILAALMFILVLLTYTLIYYRHNLLYIFNMRQLLQFVRNLFRSSDDDLYRCLYRGVNDVRQVETVCVAMVDVNDSEGKLKFNFCGDVENRTMLEQYLKLCFERQSRVTNQRERLIAYPLTINIEGESRCMGALGFMLHDASISKTDDLTFQIIAEFFVMHSFFNSTRVDEQRQELELLMDDMRRVEMEDSRIHIQNMVLDNYLSTIKHETMYYPGRIRQIAEAAMKEPTKERLNDLAEITHYYKEVLTLLNNGAARQLEKRVFKREKVSMAELAEYARQTFAKRNRKLYLPITFEVGKVDTDCTIMTDDIMCHYMIDSLLTAAIENESAGTISLNIEPVGRFVRISFTDSRMHYTEEELSTLFYADSIRYDSTTGVLQGQHFLLLKQMVREHDEYSGHKGCRIYAETMEEGGTRLIIEL